MMTPIIYESKASRAFSLEPETTIVEPIVYNLGAVGTEHFLHDTEQAVIDIFDIVSGEPQPPEVKLNIKLAVGEMACNAIEHRAGSNKEEVFAEVVPLDGKLRLFVQNPYDPEAEKSAERDEDCLGMEELCAMVPGEVSDTDLGRISSDGRGEPLIQDAVRDIGTYETVILDNNRFIGHLCLQPVIRASAA